MTKVNKTTEITVDEWLQELEKAEIEETKEGFFTVQELTSIWNICEQVVRRRLKIAASCGWLERVKVKRLSPLNSMFYSTNAYRLKKPEKSKK